MKKQIRFIYLLVAFFGLNQAGAQIQTLIVSGNISTTTAAPINNINVQLHFYDTLNVLYRKDSVFTDTMGNYTDSILYSNDTIKKVVVQLSSCTSSSQFIRKTIFIPSFSGVLTSAANFTNYCFEADIIYFDSSNYVTFTGQVAGGLAPYLFFWDFDDGSPPDTIQVTNHHYTSGGPIYNVQLTVLDSVLDTTRITTPVNTNNCAAVFTHKKLLGFDVQFGDSSFTFGPHFNIWNFGDGTSATSQHPIHTYGLPGLYNVCLQVSDSMGTCTDLYCDTVEVDSVMCFANFNYINQQNIYHFQNTSASVTSPSALKYMWEFNDGSAIESLKDPTHVYKSNGVFPVSLVITDTLSGCADTLVKIISLSGMDTNKVMIAGKITYEGILEQAKVSLIYEQPPNPFQVWNTMTTFEGYYSFSVDPSGLYYVKAELLSSHPDQGIVAPVYFKNGYFWQNATGIVISGSSSLSNNIDLQIGQSMSGPGSIDGMVRRSNDMSGVSDVEILVFRDDDVYVTRSMTDVSGYYAIPNLAESDYKVYADLPGKGVGNTKLTIAHPVLDLHHIDFTVFESTITGIDAKNSDADILIYPNPAGDFLTIEMGEIGDMRIECQIYDLVGNDLIHETFNPGVNKTLRLDLRAMLPGVYLLVIEKEGDLKTFSFYKTH